MKTLDIMFTRGDHSTQPGGVILRYNEHKDEYVTHRFNRLPHTRDPKEFFWGHYFSQPGAEQRARADFDDRCNKIRFAEISEAEIIGKCDAGFDISGNYEGNVHA